MNLSPIDLLAISAAVIAVWMCGITRLKTILFGLAIQTALLACITILQGMSEHAWRILLLAGVVILVKALFIPLFLSWSAQKMNIRRDSGVFMKPSLTLMAGFCIFTMGYFIAPQVANPDMHNVGAAGMAISMLLMGMLMMMTRRLAISQVIGFLVLENGIFLYGLTQTSGLPMMMELGTVFDVLVGVLISGVVIFRINRNFEHMDVTQMRGLRH